MLLRRSRNRTGARIRSWLVLLAGFGGLLALVITAGANALVSLDRLRGREAATRRCRRLAERMAGSALSCLRKSNKIG